MRIKYGVGDLARKISSGVFNTETKTIPIVTAFKEKNPGEMVHLEDIRDGIIKVVGILDDVPLTESFSDVLSREPVKEHCLTMSGDSRKDRSFGITQYGKHLMPLFAYNICQSHETGLPSYMLFRAVRKVNENSDYHPTFINSEIIRHIYGNGQDRIDTGKLVEIMDKRGLLDTSADKTSPKKEKNRIVKYHLEIMLRDDSKFIPLVDINGPDYEDSEICLTETGRTLYEKYGLPSELFFAGDGGTRKKMEQYLELLHEEDSKAMEIYSDALSNYIEICPHEIGKENKGHKFKIIYEISENGGEIEAGNLAEKLEIPKRRRLSVLRELKNKNVLYKEKKSKYLFYKFSPSFGKYIRERGLTAESVKNFHKNPA